MTQVLHIFRKDLHRHWIEIILCQLALAAYCWREMASWAQAAGFHLAPGPTGLFAMQVLGVWIRIFLPIAWFLLTFRLVQSEPLVGDRQFWVTRPYEWTKLLFEKIFFLLAFISLPTLLAGAFLLAKAGFPPLPHVAGLVWMQVMLLQPLLVFVALAAVTRNLPQGVLIIIPVVFAELILQLFLNTRFSEGSLSHGGTGWLQGIVFIVTLAAALLLQYSRRSTWFSRACLAAALFVAPLIAVFNPLFAYGERAYTLPAEGQPTSIRASLDTFKSEIAKHGPVKYENVVIQIPMVLWGVPDDSLASVRGARVTLEAPDGFKWHSDWGSGGDLLGPNENHWRQSFLMNNATYERMRGIPLKAKISLATEVYRQQNHGSLMLTEGEFEVPRVGRCRIDPSMPSWLSCHSPLVLPAQATVLRADPATSTCPCPNKEDFQGPWPGMPYAWMPGRIVEWAQFGVSPVELFVFRFDPPSDIAATGNHPGFALCPGTRLNLSFLEVVGRTRVEFQVNDFKLEDYYQQSFDSRGMWGFSL